MTKQESFKRSVRARMAKTGEKYGAARRALIERGGAEEPDRPWVEQPDESDAAVLAATGQTWDEWCTLIDGWPERHQGHTAMAARVNREELDDGWWAQAVVVGYERIRGLRTKYLRADGTFAGGVSRTITTDGPALRARLLDPAAGHGIIGRLATAPTEIEVRSRPDSKAVRLAFGPDRGWASFSITEADGGRVRVAIQHESLPSADDVEHWKRFWADWLASIDGTP